MDAVTVAGGSTRSRKNEIAVSLVNAGVPRFLTVDDPFITVFHRMGIHVGGI